MSLDNRTETEIMGDPLRIRVTDTNFNVETAEGLKRVQNQSRITSVSRLSTDKSWDLTTADAEAAMQALEDSTRKGTLYDSTVYVLGILQTPRYTPDGKDNAELMTRIIAESSRLSENGTQKISICSSQSNCNKKPITRDEIVSLMHGAQPITADMRPNRAIVVGTAAAAVNGYIVAATQPSVLTGTKTPADFTREDQKKVADAVKVTRDQVKACFSQTVPDLDLRNCALAGARAAIHFLATSGVTFKESDPAVLEPTPDAPLPIQKAYAEQRQKLLKEEKAAQRN